MNALEPARCSLCGSSHTAVVSAAAALAEAEGGQGEGSYTPLGVLRVVVQPLAHKAPPRAVDVCRRCAFAVNAAFATEARKRRGPPQPPKRNA